MLKKSLNCFISATIKGNYFLLLSPDLSFWTTSIYYIKINCITTAMSEMEKDYLRLCFKKYVISLIWIISSNRPEIVHSLPWESSKGINRTQKADHFFIILHN